VAIQNQPRGWMPCSAEAAAGLHGYFRVVNRTHHRVEPLFPLFLRKIISQRNRVARGNPGSATVQRTKEQRNAPLFCRCFLLFLSGQEQSRRGIVAETV